MFIAQAAAIVNSFLKKLFPSGASASFPKDAFHNDYLFTRHGLRLTNEERSGINILTH